ncbi:DUF4430 domain-containing protein [Exiguobacterium sp. ERU656]|uniref:DUF4430 domain-containing protein n=1 Tax=Exiguobacterium sp. ERU656 TaxID=2751217 RepID=UPI001BEB8944|nr:DUF4430 domain-containing protein [Exiguobacterium sp. ERU656]
MKKWLIVLSSSLLFVYGCSDSKVNQTNKVSECAFKVKMSVLNIANNEEFFNKNVCTQDSQTALEVLEDSKLKVVKTGKGEMSYVTSINNVREKSAGTNSGWVLEINDKPAEVGAGSYQVKKGDSLQWRFEKDAIAYFE